MTASLGRTKALEAAATRGPWEIVGGGELLMPLGIDVGSGTSDVSLRFADAEFIADARSAVPALVAAVERVQALHTKSNQGYGEDDYCDCCGTIWPCLTIEALETP